MHIRAHECSWMLMSSHQHSWAWCHEHSWALMSGDEHTWVLIGNHLQSYALLSMVPWHSEHSWVLMSTQEHSWHGESSSDIVSSDSGIWAPINWEKLLSCSSQLKVLLMSKFFPNSYSYLQCTYELITFLPNSSKFSNYQTNTKIKYILFREV